MRFINLLIFRMVVSDLLLNYYIYNLCFVDIVDIGI